MLSKKFLGIMTAVFMLAGVGGTSSARNLNSQLTAQSTELGQSYSENTYYQFGGPVDLSIANEEKVIDMLKKEGKIPNTATAAEAHEAFIKFMKTASKNNKMAEINSLDRNLKAKNNERVEKYTFEKGVPDSSPKTVKVLTLLVEYSDYKHSNIQPEETDLYYKDYSKQHYQDMIFGDNGYLGPNGEKLVSMRQYYKEQSGGSLLIDGGIAGWYTLSGTAASYGAPILDENGNTLDNDINPRSAVKEALALAAKDKSINFADYDQEDPYDLDGDGNVHEPDNMIDYLMVLHAGVGEEAGGGSLGSNAIWSHSWNLGGLYRIPGSKYMAYRYTIEPEDGATGVFAHEFGHNLGLPDEYDTIYSSSAGEPISMWSIMSSGSWAGKIAGTEPTGFSPYAKQYFQAVYGGNWQKQVYIDYNDLSKAGARVELSQASKNGQAIRVNLPDKAHALVTPTSGTYAYWGGKGSDGTPIKTDMTTKLDLTGLTEASLKFKANYDIEYLWDFATIQVREEGTSGWTYLPGNITTTKHAPQAEVIVPYGITGSTDGKWVDGSFDLTSFAGKKVELKIEYETDSYSFGSGIYIDDIQVTSGDRLILSDDAENPSTFTLNGFEKNTGTVYAPQYYLIEWRGYYGVDQGLKNVSVLGKPYGYDPGMVVWYVDDYYTDNWTGVHPGEGYLGIVDADQTSILWNYADSTHAPMLASGKYQMRDAAFSKNKGTAITINTDAELGRSPVDTNLKANPKFDDSENYLNSEIPSLGRNIPKLGLTFEITRQAVDNSTADIKIMKK